MHQIIFVLLLPLFLFIKATIFNFPQQWQLISEMEGKRTRSSGPVQLIVSTFSKEEETAEPMKKQPKESKPKIIEQKKNEIVVRSKPFKEHCLKNPSKYKERLQAEMAVKHSKIQVPKSETAQMTKEQKQHIDKILKMVKNRETRVEKDKMMPSEPHLEKKQQQKMHIKKKQALVDLHFSRKDAVRVYVDSKDFVFSATFNHTDVSKNANKFYIMQILQQISNHEQFYVFTRWGRVGLQGNKAQAGPLTLQEALENYRGKIQQKLQHGYKKIQTQTENQRRNFYFPLTQREKRKQVQSKLDTKVQALIRLLFDMKMVASQLKEIGLDAKKMPLGKVAPSTIIKGYEALKEVMEAVRARKPKELLQDLSSKFYSHIPHDFGMKVLSNYVLDSEKKVRDKLQLLQSLQDIQAFTKMIDEPQLNLDLNQLDANQLKLSYNIVPLPIDSPLHATILKYMQNTHAPSHNQYRLELNTIYQLTTRTEIEFHAELGNRKLLWHGSRLTNFVGILSSGLRIAPPEAPATGYMFGKGVYFADVVSKSANYCHATKLNPIACLLLCEVALGNPSQKFYADYYANLLPEDCHSVKGVGRSVPREAQRVAEMSIPNGPLVESGISNTSLHFNEYVVYDVKQIRCRFLLKVKFLFK